MMVDDFKKESTKKEKAKDYEPQAFDKGVYNSSCLDFTMILTLNLLDR